MGGGQGCAITSQGLHAFVQKEAQKQSESAVLFDGIEPTHKLLLLHGVENVYTQRYLIFSLPHQLAD
jgi:hypothetical protein